MDVCSATATDSFNNISALAAARMQLTPGNLQEENALLRAEVDELRTQLQQYKLVAQSFEMRVLDLQKELTKRDEEAAANVTTTTTERSVKSSKHSRHISQKHDGGGEQFHSRDESDDNGSEPEQFRKLFVGGLSYTTTDESLREYFSKFGQIVDCVVMKDAATKRSRGFGFVVYSKISMVDDAQNGRPHVVDKREVETKRAVPKGDQLSDNQLVTKKIFVGGLRETTDEAGLNEYFSQFGKVDHVDLIEDRGTKRPRGFAYVTFFDYDPVDKAVLQKFHTIDGRRCEVKKAMSKVMIMKNKMLAGGGGQQQPGGWNNNSCGGGGYDMLRAGGMFANGNGGMTNNMGGCMYGADFMGGRHSCSGYHCSAGANWGGHYCGAGSGYQDNGIGAGVRGTGVGGQYKGGSRSHDHLQKNSGKGTRNSQWSSCAFDGDRISSPNEFASD